MTFENTDFRQETLDLDNPFDVRLVTGFLLPLGFEFEPSEVECTMIVYTLSGELVGTGSHKGRILKYIAVAPKYRDTTAFALIVTFFTEKLLSIYKHTFVFTRPENSIRFRGLGYSEIACAPPLFCVLEFGFESILTYQTYLNQIKQTTQTDNIASIVVNCNPFTNGHLYLIEKASQESELVYLFVVEENHSVFPFHIRWNLIEQGIKHLKNVIMVKGGMYIVSGSIFPSYFLKNETVSAVMEKQAELDVTIFANYIVPKLDIKKRYVGNEVYCKTTAAYNRAMHKILPDKGVKMIEIERKTNGQNTAGEPNYISASKIRQALKMNQNELIKDFLPASTFEFLTSIEGNEIIGKIMKSDSRH